MAEMRQALETPGFLHCSPARPEFLGTASMLQAASKAGRVLLRQPGLSLAPWALPGGSLPAAWLPAAAAACRSRAGFASDRRRTDGARSAAEDLAAAARDSVRTGSCA